MKVNLNYQPKQLELRNLFFSTGLDSPNIIGGGGSRAGGKSGSIRRIMLERRLALPHTTGAIIRRVYDEVKRNHIDPYFEEIPELRKYYRVSDSEICLPNGSKIVFAYAENQQEVDRKFWGVEYYDIIVDQAEQFTERELTIIKSCNRSNSAPPGDCKLGLFFNPGGIGTEYLRRVFAMKRFHNLERPSDFSFVHLFGWDNYVWFKDLMEPEEFYSLPSEKRFEIFINDTQEGRKLNALPPSLRAGHLLGSFDSFAGQYYAGVWDESKLILAADQEQRLVQPWWKRWMAHDVGFVHHAAAGTFATGKVSKERFEEIFGVRADRDHVIVVITRDMAEQEVEDGEFVRRFISRIPEPERKTYQHYFISPDATEKDRTGRAIIDTVTAELRLNKLPGADIAANSRIPGWRYLYAMMKKTCDVMEGKCAPVRIDSMYEEDANYSENTPLLFISGHCQEIIESIPMLIRDDKHPGKAEDVLKMPTKADDVGDMVRYGVYSMLKYAETPISVKKQELWLANTNKDVHTRVMEQIAFNAKQKSYTGRKRTIWSR